MRQKASIAPRDILEAAERQTRHLTGGRAGVGFTQCFLNSRCLDSPILRHRLRKEQRVVRVSFRVAITAGSHAEVVCILLGHGCLESISVDRRRSNF